MVRAVIRIIADSGKLELEFLVGGKWPAIPYACVAGGGMVYHAGIFPFDYFANMDGEFGWLKCIINDDHFARVYHTSRGRKRSLCKGSLLCWCGGLCGGAGPHRHGCLRSS